MVKYKEINCYLTKIMQKYFIYILFILNLNCIYLNLIKFNSIKFSIAKLLNVQYSTKINIRILKNQIFNNNN